MAMRIRLSVFAVLCMLASSGAQACACCACDPCVLSVLISVKSATKAGFKAWGAAFEGLKSTVSSGLNAQTEMDRRQADNIVSALQGVSAVISTSTNTSIGVELKLAEAERNAELIRAQSAYSARHAFRSSEEYGFNSVPRSIRALHTFQDMEVVGSSADPAKASIPYMRSLVAERRKSLRSRILPTLAPEHGEAQGALTSVSKLNLAQLMASQMIPLESIPLYADAIRLMYVPQSVQSALRNGDEDASYMAEYQKLAVRVDALVDFFAWDAALRSQIEVAEGDWSFMLFVRRYVEESYGSKEGIEDDVRQGERGLLQAFSAHKSVSNLLDTLLLESARHAFVLDAALVGFGVDGDSRSLDFVEATTLESRVKK